MHAALGVQITIRVLATHEERRGFYSHFFTDLHVDRLRLEAASLDPSLIHPQQHVGPVARFRSARSRVDGDESARGIVGTGKKLPQLEFLQLADQTRVFRNDFVFSLRSLRQVAFLGRKLLQDFEVFRFSFEREKGLNQGSQPRHLLDVRLRPVAVIPKIWRGHPRFDRA